MTIIVTRGLPGSGKTTETIKWLAEDPENRVRVSRDDIRAMLFGPTYSTPEHTKEKLVSHHEEHFVSSAVSAGKDVVVDALHLKAQYAKKWFNFSDDVEFWDFAVPPTTAVWHDAQRASAGGRALGASLIMGMAKRFHIGDDGTLPKPPERSEVKPTFVPYVPDRTLRKAFIFDIDGTLAKMNGRDPYDGTQYHTDTLHEPVAYILKQLHATGHAIVVVTGRDGSKRGATEKWLADKGLDIYIDALFTRTAGDERNDGIVKAEILHRDIAPRYNVLGSFDDRDRVVDAWRALGIKCYQVERGNF